MQFMLLVHFTSPACHHLPPSSLSAFDEQQPTH